MAIWKKYLLFGAGFGVAFGITIGLLVGGWVSYQSLPEKPKPWNTNAIVASFDYPARQAGEKDEQGKSEDHLVLHYTLQNNTELDYRMPAKDQLVLNMKLQRENSLSADGERLRVTEESVFLPPKQRISFSVLLNYPIKGDFGPEVTSEDPGKRRKAIAKYIAEQLTNLDGFVVFDTVNRYQIDFPNGWKSMAAQ